MSNIHQLLQSRPWVGQQITVLHELNTALTMASGHPSQNRVEGVIHALVPLLSEMNNEVVLLAIRALITCIDITPRTVTSLVESGAVTPMCERLLKIQDMDVAEACLKCIHLLSKDNPRAVLEAGGAKACLAFFDFFPLELQQIALGTVARLVAPGVCGRRSDVRRAREILPFLRECLQKQQAGGAVAGESSGGFHGGGIGATGRGGGGYVRRSSTASVGGTLRAKDGAGDVSQMASLCLERMVVSFSTPIENATEPRSVSRKLRRSRSNFSFRAPPQPCDRQRPPSLRVANENPAPGTSETPSDPVGAPAVTEAAATANGSEPVGERSKQEGVPTDEGGGAADGEGETSAGAAAAVSSSSSVSKKGKGKARASSVGASSSAPPLPAASGGGARNKVRSAAISPADGGVALGDQPVDGGSMMNRSWETAIELLVELSQKGNRAASDEEGVSPAVDAASAVAMATVGDGLPDVVGFRGMEVDGDEGQEKEVVKTDDVGDRGSERAGAEDFYDGLYREDWWKKMFKPGMSREECRDVIAAAAEVAAADEAAATLTTGVPRSGALVSLIAAVTAAAAYAGVPAPGAPDPPVRAAAAQSSRKAPVAAPHGGEKKKQMRLAGGLKAWQVAFVLEIAEGGVLSAWSRTLEDSVKALGGASGDLAPGWRLQSRLLSTIARVVSAAPVAVQALFDVGMPRLLRRILADYVRCDLLTVGGARGTGSTDSKRRWKPSPLADSRIGEERLLAALGLVTAMLPPPPGKTKDSKASSSRRGKGTTQSRRSPTAATASSPCVRAVEGEPESMDVDESPDTRRGALQGLDEDSVTGEKMDDSDGRDCTDDDERLPLELEQAAAAAAAAAAGKRREMRGRDSIGRGHFGARDAYEAGAQSRESTCEARSLEALSGGDGGVEETKAAGQGTGERSPAAAAATADGTGGPSEDVNRDAGGPDGDATNPPTEFRTAAKTNSSVSSPSLLPAIGGSEVEEEHRQRMTGVEGPTANAAAPRSHVREENNGDGVSANGDPAQAQARAAARTDERKQALSAAESEARARRVAEDVSKAAAAHAAAAASAARAAREAAVAASEAEWACSACTFINHGSGFGRVCEVCGTPNASAVATVTAGGAGGFFGGGAPEARLQALGFRGGRGVGSSGGGMSIWESEAMGDDGDENHDGSGIPGFPPHWHRGVGAGRGENPERVGSRNQAEAVEEDDEDADVKNSEMFAPDDKVFVRLRHVYGQDEGLFQEFSQELLAPLLRLIPSGLSSPEAVRLGAAALVSLRHNSVKCLLRKEFGGELAAALYRLLSKREGALRTGALTVAKAVLQSRSPEELGEACISRGKIAGTSGREEMVSSPPSSASVTGGAAYYREVFARHGVLKLVEGSRGKHPSPAFDAEVQRAPSTNSSSSGSPQPLHPTLVNLRVIAARIDPSSPPYPCRLDCGESNNGDRHGGGRLPRTAKDEGVVVSPASEQSTTEGNIKGKGKAVCPQGGEREETGGGSSCLPSGLSLRGVLRDGPGPKKFTDSNAPAEENGIVGSKNGDGSDVSLAFSDLTRALKGHLGGITTFEAEESGVLRALLRALLNGAHGNVVSAGALAAGEESAESLPEGDTAPWRKQTHVAPSGGVHRKGEGGEKLFTSFDNGLAPMDADPVAAAESTQGYGVASMATPSGSSVTPGAAFIKLEFDDSAEAHPNPVAALQPTPSRPRGEAGSSVVAATDGDVRGGSAATSSRAFGRRGAAVGTRLTGSDFFLEVGKALLTPGEDGRLPMESLISTTQGCLQALTDDVMVVNHGGDTEAAHYCSLVRPFTVLLSPGPCPPRASPPVPEYHASSHSSEPRPGSAADVKVELLSPFSASAAGCYAGGGVEEVPNVTAPANAAAAATATISALAMRPGYTGMGGRSEAAMAEKMEAQAGLLRSLAVGLHPVLLVEPLTTVGEVIKWYTVQLGKAFKLHKRRQRQRAALERQRAALERQRAAQEEAQSRVIATTAAAASALAAAASATEAATPSANSLDVQGGSCSSSATTDRPQKIPRSASPDRAVPLLTTSEGSPIRHESPVSTRGEAAATATAISTAASTGSGSTLPKRTMPDRAAKRNSGMAQSGGSKTVRGARKSRVSRRSFTSSLSSSVSGHAGGDSAIMAPQKSKGESIEIELAVARATDAAAAAAAGERDRDGAAASTAASSSVSQRAVKRRRESSTRANAEAASGGEGGSSTPRSGRGLASSRSSSRSRGNKNTAAAGKTAEDESSNTRLRKRRKVEGGGSSSGVVMATGSSAAPSPASGSSQGAVPGLAKMKGSAVGGGGVESGEGGSAGENSKPEPTRLRPGREVFCCFRTSQGEDRSGMWYRGTVRVHHRDGTLDVRFVDGDLRINIPRSHVTITLPSVVQVYQEKRPWRNLWSPEQQQATPVATSTVSPSSGAGDPSVAAEAAAASSCGTSSTKEAKAPSTGPPPVASSRSGAGGPSSRDVDTAASLERELALLRYACSMQDDRNAVRGFGGDLGERGDGLSGGGSRAAGSILRMTIPGMVDEDSPAGPGVRIQLMSTRRDTPPRPAPGSPSSAARQGPGVSESRSSGTPREGDGSRVIGGGVGERKGASDGQRGVSQTRSQPGAKSGGGVEGGVAPHGKGQQQSKGRDGGGASTPSMTTSGSRLASASPPVASTTRETAAAAPSAASETTSTKTEGRPVARQSSAASPAGGEGSSSNELASPGRRSSKRKRSTGGNAGGSGVAGDSGAADVSAGASASVDGRVLRRASTRSGASTFESQWVPPAFFERGTSDGSECDSPFGIKGWVCTKHPDDEDRAGGHSQSGTNRSSSSRSRSTMARKTRASATAAAAAEATKIAGAAGSSSSRRSSAPSGTAAAISRRGDEDGAEAEPKPSKRMSSPARGSGARSRAASPRRRGVLTSPASGHADRTHLPMIPMFPPRGASSAGDATSQVQARSMGGTEAEEASAGGRSKIGGGGRESAGGSRDSVRFPRLQWTLRYHRDAASAANGGDKRETDVDVTLGEISKGATIFEAVQLLMFKHSQETEGDVPRTSNWDLFKHRSMRVPLEQWGKSITLEFSPRRPKSSLISQVEGVSGAEAGARQSVAGREEESASAPPTAPSSMSPLPTAEIPTTMETPTSSRKPRGSSSGEGRKRKKERESRSRPFKVRQGAGTEGSSSSSLGGGASASKGVQVFELPVVLTPGATPLDARLASLRALLEGGGIGPGLPFGEHMCLLAALQAFCEEWGPLRKRLALGGQVNDDVPDPHPSVLHDLARRCVVAGLQRKVSRQACNPLALCSGSLPSWCVRLPEEFPTLFSLETRLALYQKTSFGMARAVADIQKKAKNVEDQPQGSGSSESLNEMMVGLAGVAGRGRGQLGHGGPDAAATPLPELLRQLGRLGRLTVLLSRDSILEMATFLFGLLVNGQQQPPHQRSIQAPTSSGPEAGSSGNRQHAGRASAAARQGGGGGVVGGAGTGVRGFGGGRSGSSSRLGYGDFDVYNDDHNDAYVSDDDTDGEENAMAHEENDEGGDGGGDVAEMELDDDTLSDAEQPDPGHGHGLPQQAQQPQPLLPSEAGDGSPAVAYAAENKEGNAGRGEEASRGRRAPKDRRVATVEASVPPQHAGRQAENLADTDSMLLVEFAGETGHGTGPTLEFYTLVCRELTRKGLGMWRGDDVSRSTPQGVANSSTVSGGQEETSKTSPTPEGLDWSEAEKSGGKGSASRGVEGGDGPVAFSQQDDMVIEEEDPFLQVGAEGLFPAPLDVQNRSFCASVEARFRLLGRVMGKALKDGRMLDLPLALPLCSLIVGLRRHHGKSPSATGSPGEENGGRGRSITMESGGLVGNAKPLTLVDVGLVDAALGRSLESVAKLAEEVQRAKAFEEMNHERRLSGQGDPDTLSSPPPRRRSLSDLEACAGALCLSWSLPGCPWYELRPGGANEDVAATDLAEWVDEVTRVFLVDSVVKQVEALVKGVSEVIDPLKLSLLTARDLQRLVGGEAAGGSDGNSEWEYHRIMGSLVCRHGYTVKSPQVKWLAQVMASLDPAGRRQFLRFVTGTPRLPIGGFAALRPRLTVVRKEVGSELGGTPDAHLPSCSTCQVYLKLPAYSSKAVLERKLLHAITEGQDHFALD